MAWQRHHIEAAVLALSVACLAHRLTIAGPVGVPDEGLAVSLVLLFLVSVIEEHRLLTPRHACSAHYSTRTCEAPGLAHGLLALPCACAALTFSSSLGFWSWAAHSCCIAGLVSLLFLHHRHLGFFKHPINATQEYDTSATLRPLRGGTLPQPATSSAPQATHPSGRVKQPGGNSPKLMTGPHDGRKQSNASDHGMACHRGRVSHSDNACTTNATCSSQVWVALKAAALVAATSATLSALTIPSRRSVTGWVGTNTQVGLIWPITCVVVCVLWPHFLLALLPKCLTVGEASLLGHGVALLTTSTALAVWRLPGVLHWLIVDPSVQIQDLASRLWPGPPAMCPTQSHADSFCTSTQWALSTEVSSLLPVAYQACTKAAAMYVALQSVVLQALAVFATQGGGRLYKVMWQLYHCAVDGSVPGASSAGRRTWNACPPPYAAAISFVKQYQQYIPSYTLGIHKYAGQWLSSGVSAWFVTRWDRVTTWCLQVWTGCPATSPLPPEVLHSSVFVLLLGSCVVVGCLLLRSLHLAISTLKRSRMTHTHPTQNPNQQSGLLTQQGGLLDKTPTNEGNLFANGRVLADHNTAGVRVSDASMPHLTASSHIPSPTSPLLPQEYVHRDDESASKQGAGLLHSHSDSASEQGAGLLHSHSDSASEQGPGLQRTGPRHASEPDSVNAPLLVATAAAATAVNHCDSVQSFPVRPAPLRAPHLACGSSRASAHYQASFWKRAWVVCVLLPTIICMLCCVLGLVLALAAWTLLWVLTGQTRTRLLLFWVAVLAGSLPVMAWLARQPRLPNIILRKGYHIVAVLLFAPAVLVAPNMLRGSLGIALAALAAAEAIRISGWPSTAATALSHFMRSFIDARDSGVVLVTHVTLLLGMALPVWLAGAYTAGSPPVLPPPPPTAPLVHPAIIEWHWRELMHWVHSDSTTPLFSWPAFIPLQPVRDARRTNWDNVQDVWLNIVLPLTGVMILGFGDTAASVVGSQWGRRRLCEGWKKTVEGWLAGACCTMVAWWVLLELLGIGLGAGGWGALWMATLAGCMLEAVTTQLDNLFVPLYYFVMLSVLVV